MFCNRLMAALQAWTRFMVLLVVVANICLLIRVSTALLLNVGAPSFTTDLMSFGVPSMIFAQIFMLILGAVAGNASAHKRSNVCYWMLRAQAILFAFLASLGVSVVILKFTKEIKEAVFLDLDETRRTDAHRSPFPHELVSQVQEFIPIVLLGSSKSVHSSFLNCTASSMGLTSRWVSYQHLVVDEALALVAIGWTVQMLLLGLWFCWEFILFIVSKPRRAKNEDIMSSREWPLPPPLPE